MGDLSECVDARVGAARALNVHFAFKEFFRRFNQCRLNASGVFLCLPAAVIRAVIFERDFIFVHFAGAFCSWGVRMFIAAILSSREPADESTLLNSLPGSRVVMTACPMIFRPSRPLRSVVRMPQMLWKISARPSFWPI